jgi:hypothetical protein
MLWKGGIILRKFIAGINSIYGSTALVDLDNFFSFLEEFKSSEMMQGVHEKLRAGVPWQKQQSRGRGFFSPANQT